MKKIAVVVTTLHRGVFFGYASKIGDKTINLTKARNCLYWPNENQGFLGLAATGPVPGVRVGPAADITLHDVTCVARCTPEAEAAWGAAKWKG
jgi:hypothetical protein